MRTVDAQAFSEIQAFVAVAQSKSFVRAAERLGVDPPNVSRTIARLEGRIDMRLLHRTTRSVSLTGVGEGYLAYCVKLLADFDAAQEFIASHGAGLAGPLRVTIPMTFGLTELGPILSAFSTAHPKVCVETLITDNTLDLAAEGIDVAIRIGADEANAHLHARLLGRTERVLCASPAYLEQHGVPRKPADLAAHRCLIFSGRPQGNVWTLTRAGASETLNLAATLSANNSLLLREMALSGIGIAPLAHYVVGDMLAKRTLVRVLPAWSLGTLHIRVVYLSARNMSPKVRAFIEFCALHIAEIGRSRGGFLQEPRRTSALTSSSARSSTRTGTRR